MGNLCSSSEKCMTMQQWVQGVDNDQIRTELVKPDSLLYSNIHFYHLANGGHNYFTYQLDTSFIERLNHLCQWKLGGIVDQLDECSLIICTRGTLTELKSEKDILGFCLCHIKETAEEHFLYIKILCSSCKQGRNLLTVIENIKTEQLQKKLFGNTYNKIGLISLDSAKGFYEKMKYEKECNDFMTKTIGGNKMKSYSKELALLKSWSEQFSHRWI